MLRLVAFVAHQDSSLSKRVNVAVDVLILEVGVHLLRPESVKRAELLIDLPIVERQQIWQRLERLKLVEALVRCHDWVGQIKLVVSTIELKLALIVCLNHLR